MNVEVQVEYVPPQCDWRFGPSPLPLDFTDAEVEKLPRCSKTVSVPGSSYCLDHEYELECEA